MFQVRAASGNIFDMVEVMNQRCQFDHYILFIWRKVEDCVSLRIPLFLTHAALTGLLIDHAHTVRCLYIHSYKG